MQYTLALIALTLATLLGAGIKKVAMYRQGRQKPQDYYGYYHKPSIITNNELAAGMIVLAFASLLVAKVGGDMGVAEVLRYEQKVNGVDTKAQDDVVTCRPGTSGSSKSAGYSNCQYAHVTGHYTWQEQHSYQVCTSDSKGNQSCTTYYYWTTEHGDIYTPYAKYEHAYSLFSSMGKGGAPDPYVFTASSGKKWFAGSERYDGNVAIPSDVPQQPPAYWLEAKHRIESGNPMSRTMLVSYDNPILAVHDPLLETYSAKIAEYKKAGLLPDHTADIMTKPERGPIGLAMDTVAFVGVAVPNAQEWQDANMQLNAAVGMKLQGDVHTVLVDTKLVPKNDAEAYLAALKAHFTSLDFGKRAIAKNTIVVVIGVSNNSEIEWARMTTGMPFGNEDTALAVVTGLLGKPLTPRAIFGAPTTVINPTVAPQDTKSEDVQVTLSSPRGALEEILFERPGFKRASMMCKDGGETCVGFANLVSKVEPTPSQKVAIVSVALVIALIFWLVVLFTDYFDKLVAQIVSATSSGKTGTQTRVSQHSTRR